MEDNRVELEGSIPAVELEGHAVVGTAVRPGRAFSTDSFTTSKEVRLRM